MHKIAYILITKSGVHDTSWDTASFRLYSSTGLCCDHVQMFLMLVIMEIITRTLVTGQLMAPCIQAFVLMNDLGMREASSPLELLLLVV